MMITPKLIYINAALLFAREAEHWVVWNASHSQLPYLISTDIYTMTSRKTTFDIALKAFQNFDDFTDISRFYLSLGPVLRLLTPERITQYCYAASAFNTTKHLYNFQTDTFDRLILALSVSSHIPSIVASFDLSISHLLIRRGICRKRFWNLFCLTQSNLCTLRRIYV